MTFRGPFKERDPELERAESAAERTLIYCLEKLLYEELLFPVPIETWIEHPLGLRLSVSDLSGHEAGLLGGAYIDRCEIVVDQARCEDDGDFRFTCAHELGHFALHFEARRVFHETLHSAAIYRDLQEKQADRFAEAFLMPASALFRELDAIASYEGDCLAGFLEELMLGSELARRVLEVWVPNIAQIFVVPEYAVVSRLSSLQFAGGDRLLSPKVRQSLLARFPSRETVV